MLKKITNLTCVIAISATVVACATSTPLTPSQAGVNTPCCRSVSELPSVELDSTATAVSLTPKSPHFDFGFGLAPIAVLDLPQNIQGLGLEGRSQVQSTLGLKHLPAYVPAFSVIFLDAAGNILPSSMSPASGKRFGSVNPFRIVRSTTIPEFAVRAVITTDQRQIGKTESVLAETPAFMMPVAGTFINYAATIVPFEYQYATYGDIDVVLRANSQKP